MPKLNSQNQPGNISWVIDVNNSKCQAKTENQHKGIFFLDNTQVKTTNQIYLKPKSQIS